ncbi:unnamed protein product [Caenorhabditis auriculariae]|uniref:Uncharacterized protein n=1 Tax=Caenorhabditis auriculariae TaxID=2777116 RepID=A0A8S1HIU7_9PELO|nr:unnamed protein product [Caenorhabditis auriculariae]
MEASPAATPADNTAPSEEKQDEAFHYSRDQMMFYAESPLTQLRPASFREVITSTPDVLKSPPTARLTASDAAIRLATVSPSQRRPVASFLK